MKGTLLLLFFFTGLSLPTVIAQTTVRNNTKGASFFNPLPVAFGDPHVPYAQGIYCTYGSSTGKGKWAKKAGNL
jgi:hypothetical protein